MRVSLVHPSLDESVLVVACQAYVAYVLLVSILLMGADLLLVQASQLNRQVLQDQQWMIVIGILKSVG